VDDEELGFEFDEGLEDELEVNWLEGPGGVLLGLVLIDLNDEGGRRRRCGEEKVRGLAELCCEGFKEVGVRFLQPDLEVWQCGQVA
jgi:hypothetical protein